MLLSTWLAASPDQLVLFSCICDQGCRQFFGKGRLYLVAVLHRLVCFWFVWQLPHTLARPWPVRSLRWCTGADAYLPLPVCSKVVRKSIARVLTVVNQTTRSKLREEVAGKVGGCC